MGPRPGHAQPHADLAGELHADGRDDEGPGHPARRRRGGQPDARLRPAALPRRQGRQPRKVEALETASEQLALFANLSETDQREMLASFADGQGDAKEDYARLLAAWASGNEAAIAKAFADDKDLTPHLREILLRRRNANWAEWLKKRLATPGTVFVAVGAGHLAGPLSVQSMLAAEGITVERIWNQRDRKQRPTRH
ncbi:TraB/GumN family protein [Rhizorhabdus wittichii]|uniref:TraB/GumN family protein n=1 Tax=Rhizorhabdus wittichii TaxID=160791 RepID=UPI0021F8BFAF|nr:TraB/GumN family protein [Rhizorhabdus wittichii]